LGRGEEEKRREEKRRRGELTERLMAQGNE